ncbi:MAG: phosphonate metabolism protein/1,5-bisphosphokinase (PRPP-forming) PhnN [Rhodobacteraceae bacterium]|nr:phosphonate metabolism protein/1,5-bisphosphokinase (PRPP-forming) PhnN [Paracoccaceae bacterium]
MTLGRLIAVVGPSGVGKDSVMRGIHSAMPKLHLVRRVITRAAEPDGEAHDTVSLSEFQDLVDNGAFAVHWQAHGLHYGIPQIVKYHLNKGTDCMANFSRSALGQVSELFPRLVVLNITANPATLADRLAARGRETEGDIAKRLAQADKPLPAGLEVIHLANDRPLEQTVACALTLLRPEAVE